VRGGWAALRTVLLATVAGRCPSCLEVSMFRGPFALHPVCPRCGVRYERDSGAFLGALAIGYGFGALWVVLLGVIEIRTHWLADLGADPLWMIAGSSVLVTFFAYRPAKASWFALLFLYGFVRVDDREGATEARYIGPPRDIGPLRA